jgi:transposase
VKTKILQLKDIEKRVEMQVVMPLDLGIVIEAEDKVRTLIGATERMDYTKLARTYQRQPRRSEATPKQMFQIIILAFMLGMYSTRKIESACRNDIRFLYLLSGKRLPEHSRIARFVKKHLREEVAEDLFYQLVKLLDEQDELLFENLFLDGTKQEANANRYSFVWAKTTSKYESRADEKLAMLLERLTVEYGIVREEASAYREELMNVKEERGIPFVYGRGKRKTRLQRDVEELEELLARKAKYVQYNATFNGRNSFSKTDPDATFMRMKDDHMRNGQLKPGYNLQLGVEGEYIVGAHICAERSDELAMLGLLERMDAGLGKRHKAVVADAGYESEENYKALEERGQLAYIKPQNYEKFKKRKWQNDPYARENMPYNAQADTYLCPAGKLFERIYETTRKSKSGYEAAVTVYECFGCEGCEQKGKCTKAKGNRRMSVSKDFLALRQASRERITTDWGQTLRMNRSIQVEGAFGVLKQDYGFRRFLRRGEMDVFTEVLLYAMAYNLNKLHNKMRRNQSGCTIYLLDSA